MVIKNLITLKESILNLKKIIHDTLRAITIPNVVFQSLCCVWLFAAAWTAALQASPSLTISGVCSNSCPLNQWWHSTLSSSVVSFSSCSQSFPASGSFPKSLLFTSGGQSIELQLQHQPFQWISGLIPNINC